MCRPNRSQVAAVAGLLAAEEEEAVAGPQVAVAVMAEAAAAMSRSLK